MLLRVLQHPASPNRKNDSFHDAGGATVGIPGPRSIPLWFGGDESVRDQPRWFTF